MKGLGNISVAFTSSQYKDTHTRTAEDFIKFVGMKPERLGLVAKMEPFQNQTISYLTEAFGNVVTNKEGLGSKYQKINSLEIEWEIEQNQIEWNLMACEAKGTGKNGSDICMAFDRKYYDAYDTFQIEDTKQQFFVVEAPIRRADDFWEYTVRVVDNNFDAELIANSTYKGCRTRWIANIQPEFHAEGYCKYQSNVQLAKNWIGEIRCDIDASSRYMALEDNFVEVTKDTGYRQSVLFKIPGMKKVLLENFMEARNNALLLQKGTMDVNGKCHLADKFGRPLIAGDGALPQIERYANKINFADLNADLLNKAIQMLSQKSEQITGNSYVMICNTRFWYTLQTKLSEFLANHHIDETFMWSKTDGMIKVGACYNAYSFSNNDIMFKVDRALDYEYPDKAFALMIDLTADKSSGRPAIELFTIEGKQFIENTLRGVGMESGDVATSVAGVKYVISGYQGVAVYCPFRSVIMVES